jgi:hypothetical protein
LILPSYLSLIRRLRIFSPHPLINVYKYPSNTSSLRHTHHTTPSQWQHTPVTHMPLRPRPSPSPCHPKHQRCPLTPSLASVSRHQITAAHLPRRLVTALAAPLAHTPSVRPAQIARRTTAAAVGTGMTSMKSLAVVMAGVRGDSEWRLIRLRC